MSRLTDYGDYDALGLATLVQEKQVSPAELLEEAILRTEEVNETLNAVVLKHYEEARAEAEGALPEGPFSGVPFLLKNLDAALEGTVCTEGSAMFANAVADHDSNLVARFKAAGLVTFGKTNSPEFGLWPVTEPEQHGASRNPWNTEHTPGGSSGGAGAAVAAHIVPVAHASDGGGSIRIPASCNGLVGLKPTRGLTPRGPAVLEGWAGQSIAHVVSRSVRDSAAMLDAVKGPFPGNPYVAPEFTGDYREAAVRPPGPLRIGFTREKWGPGTFSPEAIAGLEATLSLLESLGHHVEEAQPDIDADSLTAAMTTVISVSTAHVVGQVAQLRDIDISEVPMEAATRLLAEVGQSTPAPAYIAAIQQNHRAGLAMARFHERYDVMLQPTMCREPIPVGYLFEDEGAHTFERLHNYMGNTVLHNQTGQPAISLPLHWTAQGLPLGMMFSAAYGEDALLLSLATQIESAQSWFDRAPPVCAGELRAD